MSTHDKPEATRWADEIIEDLHALHDSELIREIDSGDALIRLDAAIAAVEEARDRHAAPPNQSERIAALEAENARLRGITPEVPPRPPNAGGSPRYGLRWNGPREPVSVPMDDGYWTPWHIAAQRIAALEKENAKLPCGHPASMMLMSAETGEPLYCEACDDKSGRRDAERVESEQRIRIAALESALEQARVALDSIARNTCCDGCQEAARVAQSALRAIGEVRK